MMADSVETIERTPIGPENYSLADEQIKERIAELLRLHPPSTDQPIVCYELDRGSVEDVARTVERTVFEKRFGEDASKMAQIYGQYEDASTFFLSVDQVTGKPVGVLRAIDNSSGNGLMALDVAMSKATSKSFDEILAAHNIDSLDDCWDIGTVAMMSDYVHADNAIQLYRAMYLKALALNKKHLLSIIDRRPHDKMTKYLGIPFEPIIGSQPFAFEGSKESVAVHGYVPKFFEKMDRHRHRRVRGWLARKSLDRLVYGSGDRSIHLNEVVK